LGENDWFSVVKVDSVWNIPTSVERMAYFVWNAYRENPNDTDAFYRNNYYTFNEFEEALKRYETSSTISEEELDGVPIIESNIKNYKAIINSYLNVLWKEHPFITQPIKLEEYTKETFINATTKMHSSWLISNAIRYSIYGMVHLLSKRNTPYLKNMKKPDERDAHFFIALQHFKKWLSKENL
tara:strand:- start:1323 stop:1871 length:549 start_codon:yes stop_codon:yes gene_type:complete